LRVQIRPAVPAENAAQEYRISTSVICRGWREQLIHCSDGRVNGRHVPFSDIVGGAFDQDDGIVYQMPIASTAIANKVGW